MNRVFFVLAVAVAVVSCQPPKNEYSDIQKAIIAKLSQSHPDIDSFVFTEYEVLDTVTTGEAIDRCIRIYSKKAEIAKRDAEKFRKAWKRKNAARCDSVVSFADGVNASLLALKDSLGRGTDSALYYCVRFSGKTLDSTPIFTVDNCFVTVGNDGEIYNMQYNSNGLHTGMSRLIPGYLSILGTGKDAE